MFIADVDRALVRATSDLADLYGDVDEAEVDARMTTLVNGFAEAVIEDRVPEGYVFDANRERRIFEFDVAFQRLVEEVLDGLPAAAIIRQNDHVYRVGFPRDVYGNGGGHRSLLRGKDAVLGTTEPGLRDPAGRFHWSTAEQRLELVADREWVLEAKQKILARPGAEPPGRDGV